MEFVSQVPVSAKSRKTQLQIMEYTGFVLGVPAKIPFPGIQLITVVVVSIWVPLIIIQFQVIALLLTVL
jgi:hypothetical protein